METTKSLKKRENIVQLLFDTIDGIISKADGDRALAMKRDKTALYLVYALGATAQQIVNLRVDDVKRVRYGITSVALTSKGEDAASGSKVRYAIVDGNSAALLEWYLRKVRPHFARGAGNVVDALFLSSGGHRLPVKELQRRFVEITRHAGLSSMLYTLDGLCYAGISHRQRLTDLWWKTWGVQDIKMQ